MRASLAKLCGLTWLVAIAWGVDTVRAEETAPTPPTAPAPEAAKPSPEPVDRKSVLAANIPFGKDEATGFWPLYRDYRRDVDALQPNANMRSPSMRRSSAR